MALLIPAPVSVVSSSPVATPTFKDQEVQCGRHQEGLPSHCHSVTYRYLDEPVEFRSSSFSSWEDSSDSYWRKETIKDADAILKTTGYSDRYEHKTEGVELVRPHISREIL